MDQKTSERRLAENQVYFRSYNEKVQNAVDEVKTVAAEENVAPVEFDADTKLYFLCECSNENCVERISMSLNEYNACHQRNDTFSVKPGHEIKRVETVTAESPEYVVVKKKVQPPVSVNELNPTNL